MKYRDIMTKGTWMLDVITNDENSDALVEYTVVKYNMTLLEAYRSWHCGNCQDCLYDDATSITENTPNDKWYETWSSCKEDVENWFDTQITEDWYLNHTKFVDNSEDCIRAYRI